MPLPEWESCTVEEASERSGYSREYIRRLIRKEKVEAVKIGTVYLVSVKSLEEYVEQSKSEQDARFGPRR